MATMALHSAPAFSHGSTSYASSSRAPAAWEHPLDHAPTYCPEVVIDIPASADLDVDRLLEPVGKGAGTLRCRVRRMREKGVLELFVEEGNIFVLSASKAGKDWLIFEQGCGSNAKQQQKQQHVARVRAHKDRTFTCIRARLDGGSAPSELLHVSHSTQNLSEDLPDLNVMRLALPKLPHMSLDAPCGVLGSRLRQHVERGERGGEDLTLLESRSPKWNGRTDTYELPFGGRANHASARNFQLVERGGQSDRPLLLYGKMEEEEFALDFAHPLSVLHAFAIVLTTSTW